MSDKKNLLSESQIRQFMKLASLTPLASGFVGGLTERTAEEIEESHGRGRDEGAAGYGSPDANTRLEEDDDAEKLRATEDELGDMDAEADREGDEIDDLESDLDAEAPAADAGEGRMISVDDFLSALESALEGVMGDEVEIDSDEMADEEEVEVADVDVADDGVDMDVEVEDEEMLEEGDDEELEERQKYGGNKKDIPDADRAKETHSGKPGPASKEDVEERGEELNKESTEATDDLVEAVTKRVAARILKSALAKK